MSTARKVRRGNAKSAPLPSSFLVDLRCVRVHWYNTAQDGSPLFLTANHCLGGSVGNWTFVFNHETEGCTGNNGPTNQTVSGAEILENSSASDFALLLLDETLRPTTTSFMRAGMEQTRPRFRIPRAFTTPQAI